MRLPQTYPFERDWGVDGATVQRYAALTENWKYTRARVGEIRKTLAAARLPDAIFTVAAAGSYGRMEASARSDADFIVVLKQHVDPASPDGANAYNAVWESLASLHLEPPKKKGVFADPTSAPELYGRSVGSADENLRVLGKRMLLMLESQPLFSDQGYEQLIDAIVERYAHDYVVRDPRKEWTFLLNDLIRYFRGLCVNYQWDFEQEHHKWPIRNIKLRHSRLLMYAGLLTLLGECSKQREDKVSWLRQRLRMTPLERLAYVYVENQDWAFFRVAGLYDVFLRNLNDPKIGDLLQPVRGVGAADYEERLASAHYANLKANSDGLVAELLRFVWSRRGVWSERFFEYLFF